MKNQIILFFLISTLCLISCKPPVWVSPNGGLESTKCRKGQCTFQVVENVELEFLNDHETIKLKEGKKTVFIYTYVADDNPNIADDEYSEYLYFEIPTDVDSFSYENKDLKDISASFYPYCYCLREVVEIEEGTISGYRIDDKYWQVDMMDLSFEWGDTPETRSISARFEVN